MIAQSLFGQLGDFGIGVRKIGMLYNEAVKALKTYHSVATAQQLLSKLETYSQVLIRLQHQAIILTIRIQAKEATK